MEGDSHTYAAYVWRSLISVHLDDRPQGHGSHKVSSPSTEQGMAESAPSVRDFEHDGWEEQAVCAHYDAQVSRITR